MMSYVQSLDRFRKLKERREIWEKLCTIFVSLKLMMCDVHYYKTLPEGHNIISKRVFKGVIEFF